MVGLRPLGAPPPEEQDWPLPESRVFNSASGTAIGDGLDLYHDACAPHFFHACHGGGRHRLCVYQFDGTYLSLVKALDDVERLRGATQLDVALSFRAEASRPLAAYLRLNLHGPERSDALHEAVVITDGTVTARFDISGIDFEAFELRSAWADIILSRPAMSEIRISEIDLKVSQALQ